MDAMYAMYKKRAFRSLRASRRTRAGEAVSDRLSLVACTTRDTVIIKDADNHIEWVNDSFTRNYGYSLEECRGRPERTLLGQDEIVRKSSTEAPAENEGQPESTPISGAPHRTEVIRYGKDGRKRWLSLECRPIVGDDGAVTGFIEIENDITERKQAEEALRQEKQAAEAATRAKSEFLATVCHEIRNPVNIIVGLMDLALQTNLDAEQRDYLGLMKISSESLLRVINDTLDLARVEAGCLLAENAPFSLRDSVGDALKMFAPEARRKGLALAYDIAPEVPDVLLGDAMRLRQIIVNLVGNAIKFTERGDVVLRVERQNGAGSEVVCLFSLSDSGAGIAREKQATIFKPFLQAESSTARIYGGSGLGLAISTRLVEMMNGSIWLESEPGRGSTFFFTARFPVPPLASPENHAADFKGLAALIAVAHPVNRRFLANTLRRWNVRVHEADSAAAIVSAISSAGHPARTAPRLVLLDDSLPDLGDAAVVERLRASLALPGGSVVILGASSGRNGRDLLRDAARCSRLTLPVKPSELLAACASASAASAASRVRFDPAAPVLSGVKPQLNLSVLLVDDSPLNRRLSQLLLEREGCRVLLADSGSAALETLDREHLDLVLMDVRMPRMDGIETTAAIRRRERRTGSHIPIFALTGSVTEQDREYCLRAGMDGYLTKPILPDRLFEAIERAVVARGGPSGPVPPDGYELDGLDGRALLARVNGDMRLLGEIRGLFLRDCGKLMADAGAAMAAGDREGFAQALHTLLGMFRSLSATAARDITERLQTMSVEDEAERVAAVFRQLEREVEILKVALVSLRRVGAGKSRPSVLPEAGPLDMYSEYSE